MLTPGQIVYRHNGLYFVYCIDEDYRPSDFGSTLINQIPYDVSKEDFDLWVKSTREALDARQTGLTRGHG